MKQIEIKKIKMMDIKVLYFDRSVNLITTVLAYMYTC